MKITRVQTSPDLQILQKVRSENNICPFCGESRKSYSIDNGISGGDIVHKKLVSAETNQPWYKCMFSGQKAKVLWYLKLHADHVVQNGSQMNIRCRITK